MDAVLTVEIVRRSLSTRVGLDVVVVLALRRPWPRVDPSDVEKIHLAATRRANLLRHALVERAEENVDHSLVS